MGAMSICRTGAAALALFAAVCASAAERVYFRWTADTNALKQVSCDSMRILAAKDSGQRYLDLVCGSGSPATNALPVKCVIDAIAAGAVLQAVIGERPSNLTESYSLVLTDASLRPVAASEPLTYLGLPTAAISVQTDFGLVTPAREDWKFSPELLEVGFLVNGEDIASGAGTGWTYDGEVLSLTNAMTYVLSGSATNNEVQVHAAANGATAVLSNAAVFASGPSAVVLEQGATLTVAANQVMMTGDKADKLAYAASYKGEPCVLATTGVTVTVKSGIPHVTGFTVSNAVQRIDGTAVTGGTAYRVMAGDDVFVYYTVEPGYTSQSQNPLEFKKVEADVTVDANTIRILKNIPYRAWNETTRQMENKVCTDYTVVTDETAVFENGKWYAVTNAVSTSNLTVNGSAHLILCDGAKLTTTGGANQAGVAVAAGNALTIYGQGLGTGELVVKNSWVSYGAGGACIGGGNGIGGGMVTVNGGVITAISESYGAGIGGGAGGPGGMVTVNGGKVVARGLYSAGIGGGSGGAGGMVSVNGGTVDASHSYTSTDIGPGVNNSVGGPVTINGGSVKAETIKNVPSNGVERVYCVTVELGIGNGEQGIGKRLKVEGLGGYGTNDIYAVEGMVYLWLPDGMHRFTVLDGATTNRYLAVVNGGDVAAERLGPIGFFANGTDAGDAGIGDGWIYFGRVLSLMNAKEYVLSGTATNDEVQVDAAVGAGVVLSNAAVFASERPAVVLGQGATLTVAANQVMLAGETPDALRYAETFTGKPCVLAGPAVTVTVKDIPHVKDVVVSNRTEAISRATVEGGGAYRVMKGDDVLVYYTVEEGYVSQSPNPLVYEKVEGDVTVDAGTVRIQVCVPYRVWNAEKGQAENRVCTNCTVVTEATTSFDDGRWYAVTNAVSCGTITVNGAAHLILCDGATLTADGVAGGQLAVYGQPSGCGGLKVSGEVTASLICEGGILSAGTLSGESLAVVGGTLAAGNVLGEKVTIDGGSVKIGPASFAGVKVGLTNFVNRAGQPLHCVAAKVEELNVEKLNVEGLDGYGTNDIYAVEGKVYLWLPNGTHRFTVSDGVTTNRYLAVVEGRDITVEPLGPIGFFVNGVDIGDAGSGAGWIYTKDKKNLTLSETGPYVLSGEAANDEVHIHVAGEKAAGATVVLSNAVVFVSGQPPALNVDQNISLLMAGGTSYLAATNNFAAVSVGPNCTLTVGLAPGADETETMIGVFNYGNVAAILGAGEVKVVGGTLAVWADRRASEVPLTRAADVFCMLAGDAPETAKVVDKYNGEAYVLVTATIAPVTPGSPFGPFTTAVAATNAMKKAVLNPRDDVTAKLGAGSTALGTYCNMFGFAVTGGDESWFVEAGLYPQAWSNVMESAQAATRQIPVSAIAALPLNTPTNVTAKGCGVPGFYYSFYSGGAVTNLTALAAEGGRNVLSGTDRDVKFEGVVKPSAAAGFFSIGVSEAPDVQPSDRPTVKLEPLARIGVQE